jgi:hypothetical protein
VRGGAEILDETEALWRKLPHAKRSRIHLACIPMVDIEENPAIVNALQRHATVVVQKSLQEGFGLTRASTSGVTSSPTGTRFSTSSCSRACFAHSPRHV